MSTDERGQGAAAAAAVDQTAADDAAEEPAPGASIQPRAAKRRKNIRQTRVTAADDDDDDERRESNGDDDSKASTSGKAASVDHVTLLEDTRALQKQRGKKTGIDTATLLLGSATDRARASLAASGAASDAEALAAAQRLSATEAALGNTFRGGGGGAGGGAGTAKAEADAAAEAEAERYVESRLAAALGRAPRSKDPEGGGDEKGGPASLLDRSRLYEPPREAKLSVLSASGVSEGAAGSALEPRGAGLGGEDDARGAVGLVEVEPSARDRLANIERTEAAKRRALGATFATSSLDEYSDRGGEGFRRKDLPTSFGGRKRR